MKGAQISTVGSAIANAVGSSSYVGSTSLKGKLSSVGLEDNKTKQGQLRSNNSSKQAQNTVEDASLPVMNVVGSQRK
jgi:hypothetical protein